MPPLLAKYVEQQERWPRTGRHILAQYDADGVIVYQAYRPSIGRYAAEHGFFGGEFGFGRMSWVKPNFLWMMYRCGWATKPDQEIVLAVRLLRTYFDSLLARAVPSSWDRRAHSTREEWQHAVKRSDVRLQWDPDHDPSGAPLERRAIQLGLRGDALAPFRGEGIVSIEDITALVIEQRVAATELGRPRLLTPEEHVYPVTDEAVRARLGLDDAA